MDEQWRTTFASWAQRPAFRRLVVVTLEAIAADLARARRPYVAWSGGKDSTVLAHLARRVDATIDVVCGTSGARVQAEVVELVGLARCQGIDLICHSFPPADERWDIAIVALRREESLRRRRRMDAGTAGIKRGRESWPMADWTWLDVWAYIVEHGIPYHPVYDRQAELGIGYDRSRYHWSFSGDPRAEALAVDGLIRWRWRHAARTGSERADGAGISGGV